MGPHASSVCGEALPGTVDIHHMNKLLRFLVALLLFSVASLVFAGYLVAPDDYKDEIQDGFAAATGHELIISGQLRVDLFPEPVLEITQAAVPGAFGDRGPPLAEIDRVRLYPRWVPLLAGRIELALVRVEGLRLYLIRDGQGRASWDAAKTPAVSLGAVRAIGPWSLVRPSWSPGPFDALAAEADPAIDWPPIGRVEIRNAQVVWDDRRSGQRLELTGLEGRASPVVPGRPIALRVTGSVRTGDRSRPAAMRAEGNFRIGDGSWPLRLAPLTVRLEGFDLGHGLAADFLLRTGVDADPDAGRYLADQVALEVRAFGAALPEGRIEATVGARVDLDLGAERLEVTDLVLRSGTLSASGTALGQTLLSAPVFTGDLRVDELDLRAWLAQRGLPLPRTAEGKTFRRFSLDTCWRLEDGQIGVSDLVLGIDETGFTGEIRQVSTDPQGYRFDLAADRLDLDPYLPSDLSPAEWTPARPEKLSQPQAPVIESAVTPVGPGGEAAPAPAVSDEVSVASAPTPGPAWFPVTAGASGNLDLEGRLRVGELALARLRFGDAELRVRTQDGELDIGNRVRRFYDGMLVGRLELDIRGTEPRVALVQRAEGVRAGRLLADLAWGDGLSGRGGITANLVATGHGADALRRSLTGTLAVRFPRGAIKGFNLGRSIREARARLRGEAPPKDLPMHTEFTDLRASAEVRNGILRNRDLVATTEYLHIIGAGTLDLVRGHIDYRFEPRFVGPSKGRGIEELAGIPIPVHLTGSFDHPRWDLDPGSVLNAVAKRRLGKLRRLDPRGSQAE